MTYDVIVIGAGAAGLMTGITAAQGACKVLLLEGQAKVGAKILMSGGTRCNVTNEKITVSDYHSYEPMRVRNILRGFDNNQAIRFFQNLGVNLVLEETGKYFPTTHSGKTVLDALLRKAGEVGIELKTQHRVKQVLFHEGLFTVLGQGFGYQAKQVVLTTGGLSYPSTGSDGVGYRIAQSFGHRLLDTFPALTPLTSDDRDLKALAGIALPVKLDLYVDRKKAVSIEGSFLFTHVGFSGPAVLDMSRHWITAKGRRELYVNFLPTMNEAMYETNILKRSNQLLRNALSAHLPQRLVETLLNKEDILEDLMLHSVTVEQKRRLIKACVHNLLAVTGAVGYSKAEVTGGGIDLSEVNAKTLESHKQPGLFFAGEIVDVDGRIGGFNFQWAWASGYAAGQAIIKRSQNA